MDPTASRGKRLTWSVRGTQGESPTGRRATNMWARRLLIGSGLAITSLVMVPSAAGAASCGSMSGVGCSPTPTIAGTSKNLTPQSQLPATLAPGTSSPTHASTTSLPFTGADIEELAVVGVGAVLAGSVLMRRRRRPVIS